MLRAADPAGRIREPTRAPASTLVLAPTPARILTPQGVYTYFGCDRNVTSTHYDRSENLLICIAGTKRLWLYPPSDASNLYPASASDASRSAAPPFQAFEQLTPKLKAAYPNLAHARPVEANLRPGDMLYLPACWWHCVEGSRERNMILNWWFALHPTKTARAPG